jgi:D-sedoheptulose 7-phosphate isomerase
MAEFSTSGIVPLSAEDFRQRLLRKCEESTAVNEQFFGANAALIEQVCRRVAQALSQGQRLFVIGNGGSACDAMHVAVEFAHPIIEKRRAFPAMALTSDIAFLTAVGNDSDFSQVFSEQLKLHGRSGDIALAISTSGMSANVNYGLQTARQIGMVTIAFAGKDGGRIREAAEYCLIVPSFSIHRIQEVHTTLLHTLWDMVHVLLGAEDII